MKALKIVSGAIAAIVVLTGLLLIIGIPASFLTSTVQERIARDTGYHVTIAGSTKIGLWPALNVTMSEVTLEAPKETNTGNRLTIGSVKAMMTLSSLWSGQVEITELVINRPMLGIPLLRERQPAARSSAPRQAASIGNGNSDAPRIERVTVADGVVMLSNPRDHVEDRLENIGGHALIGADRRINVTGSARAGGHRLAFDIKASLPNLPLERQTIPLELSIDAPDLLQAPLSSKADLRLNGTVVMINGLSGTIGNGAFDGWASVDLASKPLVKLDLDFRQLDIATAAAASTPQPVSQSWSNDPIDLTGLNYVDAQLRLSAAQLNIGQAHLSPAAIEATLENGLLKCAISNLGAYGGLASGEIDIDAARGTPVYTISGDLTGVQALPLLRSAADFDKLDGKLQAKIAVRAEGGSQQAIMSNLSGTVAANFQDGAIRGLNVAQMIRALTAGPLSGWQENREQTTDLTQLSASFRIDKGQAVTTDLNLVGPLVKMTGAGTIDLGGRTLALRVEPKLVMTAEGQGRTSDPVGFGIPVVIDGPWADPRIYPDMAGILDNPDAAYAKLKEMGQGLFAPGGPGSDPSGGNPLGGTLGEALGNLLQQGLGAGRGRNSPQPASPNDPPPAPNDPNQPPQGGRSANDLLKQFFGR
jgi:AsmA protein